MRRVTMIIIISGGLLFADDFFPVGAYDVSNISYFSLAHDSLKLNTVLSGWQYSENGYKTYLDTAYYEALKVVLQQPLVGDDGTRLSWYHNMWHALWESEGTMFLHDDTIVGQVVEDSFASNNAAWVCSLGVDSAGTMQTGTWNWQLKIPVYPWPDSDSVEYTAIFQLKRDTTSQHDTIPVCILVVYSPPGNADTVFREIILTVSDFQQANVYQPCTLTFKMHKETNNLVWYKIYWYANVTLWTDYVEIKDEDIDILTNQGYNDSLGNIIQTYDPVTYPSLFRYYLQDEPRIGHYHSNAYLMRYFSETPAIQTLGGVDSAFFAFYADSVIPNELWFDYYPFFGEGYDDGRTPEESGSLFRERLDILCT